MQQRGDMTFRLHGVCAREYSAWSIGQYQYSNIYIVIVIVIIAVYDYYVSHSHSHSISTTYYIVARLAMINNEDYYSSIAMTMTIQLFSSYEI